MSSMGELLLFRGVDRLGEVFSLPVGDGEEYRHHQGGEQLEVIGVEIAQLEHRRNDHIVDDGAEGHRQQLQREIAEDPAENDLADDHGGQADDDGAPAHVDIVGAVILAHQRPGQGNQPVRQHQPQHLGPVGVDALGPGHVLVGAGGPQGRPQLPAKEPVQNGDEGGGHQPHHHHGMPPDGVARFGALDKAQGHQQLVQHVLLGDGQGHRRFEGHDGHVHRVQPQLGEDARQDGGDAAHRMEQAGGQPRRHTGQQRGQHGKPHVDAAGKQDHEHRAPGTEGAVHRQVRDVQYLIGDVYADGHNAPDKALGRRPRQRAQKSCHCGCSSQFKMRESGGKGKPFPAVLRYPAAMAS